MAAADQAKSPAHNARLVLICVLGGASQWATTAVAIDNGLALRPPRGWRSWDAFLSDVNQSKMEQAVEALTDKSRKVDGVPTSLMELGYNRVGLDDGWQVSARNVTPHAPGHAG